MSWSVSQYTKFEDERTRPVRDLLAHIPTPNVATAADLGCGPGNSTELLQARYPEAVITALDSSAEMIEAARKRLPGSSARSMTLPPGATRGRSTSSCPMQHCNGSPTTQRCFRCSPPG